MVRVWERDEFVKNKTMATLVRQVLSHSKITKQELLHGERSLTRITSWRNYLGKNNYMVNQDWQEFIHGERALQELRYG